MRIAIIILGIIALFALGLYWNSHVEKPEEQQIPIQEEAEIDSLQTSPSIADTEELRL